MRDQMVHTWRSRGYLIDKAVRDFQNQANGLVSEAGARLRGEAVLVAVLAERVRSALGWFVSHPGAISVNVHDAGVLLTGPILAHEVDPLLAQVTSVPGVTGLENRQVKNLSEVRR
jgi:hypothetical protein